MRTSDLDNSWQRVEACDLAERLGRQFPALLDAVRAALARETNCPPHWFAEEVDQLARTQLDLFVQVLRGAPAEPGGAPVVCAASRLAEEGVPLREVCAVVFAGARACWAVVAELARPDEADEVVRIGNTLLQHLSGLFAALGDGYVDTAVVLGRSEREAHQVLFEAVLADRDSVDLWRRAGLVPWRWRTVLAVRVDRPQHGAELADSVAARRRSRALREQLAELAGGVPVLDGLSATGGIVLLAGKVEAAELARVLTATLDGGWVAGCVRVAESAETALAVRAAADTAEVADRLGLPRTVHDLAALRFEVQVTRPGPARSALIDVLTPLAEHAELWHTLRTYLSCDGVRRDTARALHVHVNTLDYRLNRIQLLTTVDPTCRDGWVTLRSAMLAHRYAHGDPWS